MSDHKYSNQKSALEEYFESLLNEDINDSGPENDSYQTPVSVIAADIAENESITDTTNESVSELEDKLTPPAEPSIIEDKPPSIADMLADIEAASVEEVPEKIRAEFAEPEAVPDIVIPLPDVAPVIEVETVTKTDVEEVVTEVVEAELEVTSPPAPVRVEAAVPEWAEEPFQCLMFMVGGLSLAVPLVKLNGVIPWTENVVETPNQTDWYLGVLMNHGNKVEVIDTAVMVLPQEHRQDMAEDPAERLSHILLVDDQKWGLACDSIGEVVWLQQDDVKWRSNKTKRPWLLGTAIKEMCAVMDTEAFADMLSGQK